LGVAGTSPLSDIIAMNAICMRRLAASRWWAFYKNALSFDANYDSKDVVGAMPVRLVQMSKQERGGRAVCVYIEAKVKLGKESELETCLNQGEVP
jgi:hypothetical protein